jgi:phospholipid transport system substrate-binding protein
MFRLVTMPLLAAALAVPAIAAPAADPAAGKVDAYNQSLIAVMKQGKALGLKGRASRLEGIVRTHYDIPTIAGLVVGPKWATTSAADKSALVAALTKHSAIALAQNFKSYDGEKFTVDPKVQMRGPARIVRSTIAGGGSSDTLVYLMQPSAGDWKIVDVVARGVGQLAIQRGEYASTVASGGAAALAKKLGETDARTLAGG